MATARTVPFGQVGAQVVSLAPVVNKRVILVLHVPEDHATVVKSHHAIIFQGPVVLSNARVQTVHHIFGL